MRWWMTREGDAHLPDDVQPGRHGRGLAARWCLGPRRPRLVYQSATGSTTASDDGSLAAMDTDKFYCGTMATVTFTGDVTPCSVIREGVGNIRAHAVRAHRRGAPRRAGPRAAARRAAHAGAVRPLPGQRALLGLPGQRLPLRRRRQRPGPEVLAHSRRRSEIAVAACVQPPDERRHDGPPQAGRRARTGERGLRAVPGGSSGRC